MTAKHSISNIAKASAYFAFAAFACTASAFAASAFALAMNVPQQILTGAISTRTILGRAILELAHAWAYAFNCAFGGINAVLLERYELTFGCLNLGCPLSDLGCPLTGCQATLSLIHI